jgi:hypothetical protein
MKLLIYLILLFALPVFAQDVKTISWEEARINDRIELTITKAEFDKRYKKTDSIAAPRPNETCGTENKAYVKMLFYKGVKFELDNGILNFRSVNFARRKGMYFSIDGDWFDHTTTLKSFKKTYSEAANYIEDFENEDGETMEMITLLPEKSEDRYEWRFFFDDGKLHSIECVFTCD